MSTVLQVGACYSRKEIHDILDPKATYVAGSGTWGLQGIVAFNDKKDFVLFVTKGSSQAGYNFSDTINTDGTFIWQSQPKMNLNNKTVKELIDSSDRNIYLFYREDSLSNYRFKGLLKYISHDVNKENPVHIKWQILSDYAEYEKKVIDGKGASSNNMPVRNIQVNEYINCDDYKRVIEEYFSDGFAFENPLRKRRFISFYEDFYGKNFSDDDELYLKKIKNVGFVFEGKVYLLSMITKELESLIMSFIDGEFVKGVSALYYSSIYRQFQDKLDDLFSVEMLKEYLKKNFQGKYNFEADYLSQIGEIVDLKQELINIFYNYGTPLSIEELYSKLPHLSKSAVDGILNDRSFIVNFKGKSYFYEGIVNCEEYLLENAATFLRGQLLKKEYIDFADLLAFLIKEYPDFFKNNSSISDLGIKNYLKYKYVDDFDFRGDFISKKGDAINTRELYTNFSKERKFFSFNELEEFRDSIHKVFIDMGSVLENSIRISQNNFIRKDLIDFDISAIDNAISEYCIEDYITFNDVINYINFPSIQNIVWNEFVLESYVYAISEKYTIINASFNQEKPVGFIVKKTSRLDTLDKLLIDVIRSKKIYDKTGDDVLQCLVDCGYLYTKKLKNIDYLISEARKEL